MTKSNFNTKGQAKSGCDAEPETAEDSLGPAAETGGDLTMETSVEGIAKPKCDGQSHDAPDLDPVCGMAVDKGSALPVERDGKTFYFCSDQCRKKFLATIAGAKSDTKAGSCCG